MNKINLLQSSIIPSFHDCVAHDVCLTDALSFSFDRAGLTGEWRKEGEGVLRLSFTLSNRFCDESFHPAVMRIDHGRCFARRALTYMTLKAWVEELKKQTSAVRINTVMVCGEECFIHAAVLNQNKEETRKEVFLSFLADSLSYGFCKDN